jgi:hypothetical protein
MEIIISELKNKIIEINNLGVKNKLNNFIIELLEKNKEEQKAIEEIMKNIIYNELKNELKIELIKVLFNNLSKENQKKMIKAIPSIINFLNNDNKEIIKLTKFALNNTKESSLIEEIDITTLSNKEYYELCKISFDNIKKIDMSKINSNKLNNVDYNNLCDLAISKKINFDFEKINKDKLNKNQYKKILEKGIANNYDLIINYENLNILEPKLINKYILNKIKNDMYLIQKINKDIWQEFSKEDYQKIIKKYIKEHGEKDIFSIKDILLRKYGEKEKIELYKEIIDKNPYMILKMIEEEQQDNNYIVLLKKAIKKDLEIIKYINITKFEEKIRFDLLSIVSKKITIKSEKTPTSYDNELLEEVLKNTNNILKANKNKILKDLILENDLTIMIQNTLFKKFLEDNKKEMEKIINQNINKFEIREISYIKQILKLNIKNKKTMLKI